MKDSKAYCIVQSTKVMRTVLCKAQRRSVECSFSEAFVQSESIFVNLKPFEHQKIEVVRKEKKCRSVL